MCRIRLGLALTLAFVVLSGQACPPAVTNTLPAPSPTPGEPGEQGIPGLQGPPGPSGNNGQNGVSPFALDGNDAVYTQGNIGIGTIAPSALLDVFQEAQNQSAARVQVENPSNDEPALLVTHDGGGDGIRVDTEFTAIDARANGPNSTGVIGTGQATGVLGNSLAFGNMTPAYGGVFQNQNMDGAGVLGSALAGFNSASHGVLGQTIAPSGAGVRGVNFADTNPNGTAYGVVGEIIEAASTGIGVLGRAPLSGVVGEATAAGVGVTGRCNNGIGVQGQAQSANATGVLGINTSNVGTTYGVKGTVNSIFGYAGYFTGGRNYLQGNVGIGIELPDYKLDIHDPSLTNTVMNLQRDSDSANNSDMLQIRMNAASSDICQFIECERGNDTKFRVWGDGDVTADGTFTSPADFAEMIRVTDGAESVEPGDVIVIDPNNPRAVSKSTTARSKLVAGIYSTKPGLLGSEHDWDDVASSLNMSSLSDSSPENLKPIELGRRIGEVPVAIVGIVPCKVSAENGPIKPGDMLVTSSTPGHAMSDEDPRTGTIVGKALGSLEAGTGSIRVLVTLH